MGALDLTCPTCGARPRWGCETREGYFRERPHVARVRETSPTNDSPRERAAETNEES